MVADGLSSQENSKASDLNIPLRTGITSWSKISRNNIDWVIATNSMKRS